jgi:hypothetical protein
MTKSKDFLLCDGCGRKIRVGDHVINFVLDESPVIIHKNIECLLKLDDVEAVGPIDRIGNTYLSPDKGKAVEGDSGC